MLRRTQEAQNDPQYKSAMAAYHKEHDGWVLRNNSYNAALGRLEENASAIDAGVSQEGDPKVVEHQSFIYFKTLQGALDSRGEPKGVAAFEKIQQDKSARGQRVWGALQPSFQWISNPNIVTNGRPPTQGSFDNLPRSFKDFPDQVPGGSGKYAIHGLAQARRIAALVDGTDPKHMSGSQLNEQLGATTFRHLHQTKLIAGKMLVDTSDHRAIFSAISPDKRTIANLLNDRQTGTQNTLDLLTYAWDDDGAAAAKLLTFPAGQESSVDAARIMSAIGRHASGGGDSGAKAAWEMLSIVRGVKNGKRVEGPIGEINPLLVRAIGKGMTPFLSDLAGGERHTGFDSSWTDPKRNGRYGGSAVVFAMINTDERAGIDFNAAAMKLQNDKLAEYGADARKGPARHHLLTAGTLAGLVAEGSHLALDDEHDDALREDSYERISAAFDVLAGVYGAAWAPAGAGLSVIKPFLIGRPELSGSPGISNPPLVGISHRILEGAGVLPEWALTDPKTKGLVNPSTGRIRPLKEIIDENNRSALGVNDLDGAMKTLIERYCPESEEDDYDSRFRSVTAYDKSTN